MSQVTCSKIKNVFKYNFSCFIYFNHLSFLYQSLKLKKEAQNIMQIFCSFFISCVLSLFLHRIHTGNAASLGRKHFSSLSLTKVVKIKWLPKEGVGCLCCCCLFLCFPFTSQNGIEAWNLFIFRKRTAFRHITQNRCQNIFNIKIKVLGIKFTLYLKIKHHSKPNLFLKRILKLLVWDYFYYSV